MTWTISGNANDILIGVTRHGNALIRGKSSHTPYIIDDSFDSESTSIAQALRLLQTVQADWRITSADAVKREAGTARTNLLKRIEARPEASIAEISCIKRDNNEPALAFSLALQPPAFGQVRELFSQLLVGPAGIRYTIAVGFLTFRFPGENKDMPTVNEFLSGRPYFSEEVAVSISRVRDSET